MYFEFPNCHLKMPTHWVCPHHWIMHSITEKLFFLEFLELRKGEQPKIWSTGTYHYGFTHSFCSFSSHHQVLLYILYWASREKLAFFSSVSMWEMHGPMSGSIWLIGNTHNVILSAILSTYCSPHTYDAAVGLTKVHYVWYQKFGDSWHRLFHVRLGDFNLELLDWGP